MTYRVIAIAAVIRHGLVSGTSNYTATAYQTIGGTQLVSSTFTFSG